MRFGFREVRENPERSLFDQNGNMLRKELTKEEVDRFVEALGEALERLSRMK